LSLEKKEYEEIQNIFGINPNSAIGEKINEFEIKNYIGHGKVGIVYRGENKYGFEAAVKIIPNNTLKNGWEKELIKLNKLKGINGIAHYKHHEPILIEGKTKKEPCVCILYDFINGKSLEKYLDKNKSSITIEFIIQLLIQSLNIFHALKVTNISHEDLHTGNIMIADPDERLLTQTPQFFITDFGQGGSTTKLNPKDDYLQLSLICKNILKNFIDYSKLDGKNKYIYDSLDLFLDKELVEEDALVGEFVREPRRLCDIIESFKDNYKLISRKLIELQNPFDYLSCEHIGNSYDLLNSLYSSKFPGYNDLLQKANTIFTGPRGCGKSTIFKNLSLKTNLIASNDISNINLDFIGIYYNCKDLYFAFPYNIDEVNDLIRKQVTHYFNIALLYEILDTLIIAYEKGLKLSETTLERLQGFIKAWFPDYEFLPSKTINLNHILSFINNKKQDYKNNLTINNKHLPISPTPEYFLLNLCQILQKNLTWLNNIPFYFFLDDYSIPKIQKNLQKILNSILFIRNSELFFKISTESIITLEQTDASNKMLDEDREYDVLDFGALFLNASWEIKSKFLTEILNARLEKAKKFDWKTKNICEILQGSSYSSYNELANLISKGDQVNYSGWTTIVDLCSGDIARILSLIRDIFTRAESMSISEKIPTYIQDAEIRATGNTFLSRIEANQEYGSQLRKITVAFGNVAHHYLRTRESKNVDTFPRHQAFRIEIQEPLYFENDQKKRRLIELPDENYLKSLYENLIKYGIFIRDVRGKSQRGAVVPRLYLRRLLIPTFLLTPNQRDSIRLEVDEFKLLLAYPEKFEKRMKRKQPRRTISEKQERLENVYE
jgi:serine/threonine protein kinase